jgi:hypothetical protein
MAINKQSNKQHGCHFGVWLVLDHELQQEGTIAYKHVSHSTNKNTLTLLLPCGIL